MTVLDQQVRYTIDGLEVATYAYYPTALSGVDEFPALRGENPVRSGRDGRAFQQKVRDGRPFKLTLRVEHTDAVNVVNGSQTQQVRTNMDALWKLLGASGLRTIVRYMPDASTRTALGEFTGGQGIEDPGGFGKVMMVPLEFYLPDPYWYGAAVTPSATTINASPKAISITNAGTAPTSRLAFALVGPLTNPTITNATTGETLGLTVALANSSHTASIDCDTGIVLVDGIASPGLITHSGGSGFMTLLPGVNAISVTSSVASTGLVTPTSFPAYW